MTSIGLLVGSFNPAHGGHRGISRFRGDAQFSTWLHRITSNCANTLLGRRTRHRHDELDDDDDAFDDPVQDDVANSVSEPETTTVAGGGAA